MPPAHHVPRSPKKLFLGMTTTLSGGKIFKQQILSDPLPIHLAAQRVERVLERGTHLHPVHGPTRPLAKVKMEMASFLQPTWFQPFQALSQAAKIRLATMMNMILLAKILLLISDSSNLVPYPLWDGIQCTLKSIQPCDTEIEFTNI